MGLANEEASDRSNANLSDLFLFSCFLVVFYEFLRVGISRGRGRK